MLQYRTDYKINSANTSKKKKLREKGRNLIPIVNVLSRYEIIIKTD
jgi:hypothetical protein